MKRIFTKDEMKERILNKPDQWVKVAKEYWQEAFNGDIEFNETDCIQFYEYEFRFLKEQIILLESENIEEIYSEIDNFEEDYLDLSRFAKYELRHSINYYLSEEAFERKEINEIDNFDKLVSIYKTLRNL